MNESKILAESHSPCLDISAYVEQNDTTCFFYLWYNPNSDNSYMKFCFVSNVLGADNAISIEDWKKTETNEPPMVPYDSISHSIDGLSFEEDELEIAWTIEGSGAGVIRNGELLAFIPEWANEEFCGYSKYIKGQTPFGWEMTQAENVLMDKLKKSREFWELIEGDYWKDFQHSHLNSIENYIGKTDKYYAIDGGNFPPKALVTGEYEDILYGITLGVSVLRQPMVECFYHDDTLDFARIELGFACSKAFEPYFMASLEQISRASNIPWKHITFLGHGHTMKNDSIPGYAAFLLLNANLLAEGSSPKYEPAFGERVNLLWAVPITQEVYDFLLEFDMPKTFNINFKEGAHIFTGGETVSLDFLKSL